MNTVDYRGVQQNRAAGCAQQSFAIPIELGICRDCGGGLSYTVSSNTVVALCSWCSDPRTKTIQEKLKARWEQIRCTCATTACPVHGK